MSINFGFRNINEDSRISRGIEDGNIELEYRIIKGD